MEKIIQIILIVLVVLFFLMNNSFQIIENIKYIILNNFILFLATVIAILWIYKNGNL